MNNKLIPGLSTWHRKVCSPSRALPDFRPARVHPPPSSHWASAEGRYAETARVCPQGLPLWGEKEQSQIKGMSVRRTEQCQLLLQPETCFQLPDPSAKGTTCSPPEPPRGAPEKLCSHPPLLACLLFLRCQQRDFLSHKHTTLNPEVRSSLHRGQQTRM